MCGAGQIVIEVKSSLLRALLIEFTHQKMDSLADLSAKLASFESMETSHIIWEVFSALVSLGVWTYQLWPLFKACWNRIREILLPEGNLAEQDFLESYP